MSIQLRPAIFAASFVFVIGGAAAANARTVLAGSGYVHNAPGTSVNVSENGGRITNSAGTTSNLNLIWNIPLSRDTAGSFISGSFIGNGSGGGFVGTFCNFFYVTTSETVSTGGASTSITSTTPASTTIPVLVFSGGGGEAPGVVCTIGGQGRVSTVTYTQ